MFIVHLFHPSALILSSLLKCRQKGCLDTSIQNKSYDAQVISESELAANQSPIVISNYGPSIAGQVLTKKESLSLTFIHARVPVVNRDNATSGSDRIV